ncbi:MAG: hypothetical protein K2X82_18340 [Gemmataceae bacterium]|nr:hypothetical protein [Gemmataceae bacterium]
MNPTMSDALPPRDESWKPDPVLEARRQEIFRRCKEEGRTITYDEMDGLLADLWESDEEFARFLKFIRESRGHKD